MSSRTVIALALSATLAAASCAVPVSADPQSDILQPDFFRTAAALRARTQALNDPLGRDCAPMPSPLSLSAAVDLALCRNPVTRAAWASARRQAAALGGEEGTWLPSITASGSESRAYGEHVDVTGNLVSSPQTTRDAALMLSYTLYDFGGRSARIEGARRLLDAAAATVNDVSQQTVFNAVQSFYGVAAADAMLAAAQTSESTAGQSLEVARSLRTGGVATLGDVLQAQTAYDLAKLARVQADAAAKSARGTLAVALGLTADQPLKLVCDPVPARGEAFQARVSDLMAEAQRQRPDLAAALAQRDAARANVAAARAVGRPSISIQAGRNVIDTAGVADQSYSQVGIYVTVPIFNGFSTAYGVRQAQAAAEASEANVEQLKLGVSLSVWNAYYAVDSSNQQLSATAALTATAQDNQQVAMGRYQSGVGTMLDVLTAQTAAATARQSRIGAEYGWQVARAQLALALGRLHGTDSLNTVSDLP